MAQSGEIVSRPALWPWWVLAAMLVLEACLCARYIRRQVQPLPPWGWDQAAYLTRSYHIHQAMRDQGLLPALNQAVREYSPFGVLQPIAAALVHRLIGGPSRLGALAINLLAFVLLQVVLAWFLLWRTRRWTIALFGVGLLLTAGTTHLVYGGLLDFRFDFPVMCLYGVFLCLVLRSDCFARPRWAIAAGAAGAFVVLFRFFSGVYLGGMAVCFALAQCGQWWRGRTRPEARRWARQRLLGLLLAMLTTLLVALPMARFQVQPFWNYYVANHWLGGDRDIRKKEFGVETFWPAVTFYGRSLCKDHTGILFLTLGLGTALACLAPCWARRRADLDEPPRSASRAALGVLALALGVPLLLLTVSPSKSPIVGNIAVPPLLLLLLLPVIRLADCRPPGDALMSRLFAVLAGTALVCGGGVLGRTLTRPFVQEYLSPTDREQVNALYDAVDRAVRTGRFTSPVMGTDVMQDIFHPLTIDATLCERTGSLHGLSASLGDTVLPITEAEALARTRRSDLVLLTDAREAGVAVYPFHGCMTKIRPRLREVCDREFLFLGEFIIQGQSRRLYARRTPYLQPLAAAPAARPAGSRAPGSAGPTTASRHGR
jgi:hypothetical protein